MNFHAEKNDGTLVISNTVEQPLQGTMVVENGDDSIVVAKGIIRPQLYNPSTGEVESAGHVIEAGFGKTLGGEATFYSLRELRKERISLSLQTALFSLEDAAAFINHETDKLKGKTALDFMSKDAQKKIKYGVPPSMLIEEIAPWTMLRRFDVPGIRATVYGSTLVPTQMDYKKTVFANALEQAGVNMKEEHVNRTYFMLLPKSALNLADQLGCTVPEMVGRMFLVHRDPPLPDSTSMYPAIFAGELKWANKCRQGYGICLAPSDAHWIAAGGDFDGDAACIYIPEKYLLPRRPVSRADYKLNGRTYQSEDIGKQIIEAAENTVSDLLGRFVLSAMRLCERELDTDLIRSTAAAVAQASVQAKKHAVDVDAINEAAALILEEVRNAEEAGTKPFISNYINLIRRSRTLEKKTEHWTDLMTKIDAGAWSNGTKIELALVERFKVINQIFKDIKYFQKQQRIRLPASIISAATTNCSTEAAAAMKSMMQEYRTAQFEYASLLAEEVEEVSLRETYTADIRDKLRVQRAKFELAVSTGLLDGIKVTPTMAQYAMIAYGPHYLAARFVPASIFEELGVNTKRIIVSLCNHHWMNGEIDVANIRPIPACVNEVNLFAKDLTQCNLEVISQGPRSTRVILSTV